MAISGTVYLYICTWVYICMYVHISTCVYIHTYVYFCTFTFYSEVGDNEHKEKRGRRLQGVELSANEFN